MIEENVVSAAGAHFRLTEAEIARNIQDAGFIPKRRTMHYDIVGDPYCWSHQTPPMPQLAAAAKQWAARGRAPGLLWRGEAADEARRWHRRGPRDVSPREAAFLDAVFALATRSTRLRRIAVVTVIATPAGLVGRLARGAVTRWRTPREAA